jgi:hypothetical protein
MSHLTTCSRCGAFAWWQKHNTMDGWEDVRT